MADIHRAPKIVFSRSSEPRLRESLDGMFAGLPFKVPNGVRIQLSSALFAMQRSALLVGIEADLKLFSGREILYVKLSPAKEGELQGVLGDTEELGRFDPGAGPARKRTHSDAYAYYCEKILSPARGVDHFLSRNPKVGSLLDRSTSNFTGNVRECLSRLRADKYVLERVFLDGGAITSLSGITHTGSDSHNGGKQVLFLDLGYKNQKGKSDEKRIVYKPSDVEIDYLIAGSNTPVLRQVLEEKHSDAGFPLQHESLFELLDRTIFGAINGGVTERAAGSAADKQSLREQLALPVYTILPRNPGSRLPPRAENQLPIETSYGYLEFLEHEPRVPERVGPGVIEVYVRNKRWTFRDKRNQAPDWIVERPEQANVCFRLWGRLMTVACVFLQTDLHFQNQRIRRRKPHLINLENCLIKACATPRETLIAGNLQTPTCAPDVVYELVAANGSARTPVTIMQTRPEEYRVNQIYLRQDAGRRNTAATQVSAYDPLIALNVKLGIEEALRGMTRVREELAQWVQAVGLADVVVRHVVRDTPEFTSAVQALVDASAEPENRTRETAEFVTAFMAERRRRAVDRWDQEGGDRNNPYYSLEVPSLNGVDFQNLDVPAYYRRVGSLDLLTSRGERVYYAAQTGDAAFLRYDHYHQFLGLELLKNSFLEKLPRNGADLERKVDEFVASVYPRGIPFFGPTDDKPYEVLGKETGTVLLPSRVSHAEIAEPGTVNGWKLPETVAACTERLGGTWPAHKEGRRVAVVLIDMDRSTASERNATSFIANQAKVLRAAKRKGLDVLEVWIQGEGSQTANELRSELKDHPGHYRFTKGGTESCFAARNVDGGKPFATVLEDRNVGLAVVMGHSIDLCVKASIFGRAAIPSLQVSYLPGFLDRGIPVLTSQEVLYPDNPSSPGYFFTPRVPPGWLGE